MKKILGFIMAMAMGFGFATQAQAGERVAPSQVPNALQAFVADNFGNDVKIVAAERDRHGSGYEYDVMLSSGFKIEWGADNQWKEVEGAGVPASIVGDAIQSYVNNNYNQFGAGTIIEIDRDHKGYKVKLANGIELKFDNNKIFLSAKQKK